MNCEFPQAPELQTTQWFNTNEKISLENLRGRVVVIEAFQMLCPSCVSHSLPQAQRIHKMFNTEDVAVIGLHTVFEHHSAMTPASLKAFLFEYRITFPVGVDIASKQSRTPQTMSACEMRGTPTTILIDRSGRIRMHAFGIQDDMLMGAEITSLIKESCNDTQAAKPSNVNNAETDASDNCDQSSCPIK